MKTHYLELAKAQNPMRLPTKKLQQEVEVKNVTPEDSNPQPAEPKSAILSS